MTTPLRLGIAGLGTVGAGLVGIVQQNGAMLAARAGRPVEIAAVSARSRGKNRGIDISVYDWVDDPVALARRDDIDVFVELIGGEDGPAKAGVEAALAAGHDVVPANKAMLAIHGQAMAEAAEPAGLALGFEAAVAGAIPCIKVLGEALAGNRIRRVLGVIYASRRVADAEQVGAAAARFGALLRDHAGAEAVESGVVVGAGGS